MSKTRDNVAIAKDAAITVVRETLSLPNDNTPAWKMSALLGCSEFALAATLLWYRHPWVALLHTAGGLYADFCAVNQFGGTEKMYNAGMTLFNKVVYGEKPSKPAAEAVKTEEASSAKPIEQVIAQEAAAESQRRSLRH